MIRKARTAGDNDQTISVIGPSMEIVGTVKCKGVMQLGGTLSGEIDCIELQVTPEGQLDGQVRADMVSVDGTVTGTIHAQAVSVGAAGRITGDIHYQRISVEQGAELSANLAFAGQAQKSAEAETDTNTKAGKEEG
jgi:cytoskeletal protein CcmA (bactofilin family)